MVECAQAQRDLARLMATIEAIQAQAAEDAPTGTAGRELLANLAPYLEELPPLARDLADRLARAGALLGTAAA